MARRHLDRFISLEPRVLRGDNPDAVHDIRVASRRLQQILDLLYPKPYPQKLRKLRRTIRRTRRALSAVRNYDVLLQRAERSLARNRLSRREVWSFFRDDLAERRAARFQKAARKLGSLNLPGCFIRLRAQLESAASQSPGAVTASPNGNPPERSADAAAFQSRMIAALRQTWTAFEERLRQSQQEPSAAALHAVRIAAKRLRYLIEAMAEMGVAGSKQAVDCLRQIQEQLGDWHDLEVMEQAMLEMVASRQFLQDHLELALGTERLVLHNRRLKKRYEEEFFRMVRDSTDWARLESWVHAVLEWRALPVQQEA
ncbi:MAG: CHAD domain-containing protein [Acidobacteria bacterium]|nr:CHAD domain-containing protein [Acidobacteriota bacterium]